MFKLMKNRSLLPSLALGVLSLSISQSAQAEEVTLRAVSAFAKGTTFSVNFERYIDKVNELGKGVLQINYLGGGKSVINPFELGNALKTGVVDIGNLPGAFYTNLLPEADVTKLSQISIAEERKNGAWAYFNRLHEEKMNTHHLARQKECVPFHLYLTKKIESPDLSGLNIRTTPTYAAFFTALGGSMVRTAPGDVYTALERGVVQGYGWPTQGVLDLGWHEVTKYRVDPGFYRVAVEVLINNDKWKQLDSAQQDILNQASAWIEGLCDEDLQLNAQEKARQAEAGIETITFDKSYTDKAYEAGWAAFVKTSPEHGPKLLELLRK